jgi:hypothetical protein
MMRFQSKRDSLPRERIDDGARDKRELREQHILMSSEKDGRGERHEWQAASEILYEYMYKNTYVRIQVLVQIPCPRKKKGSVLDLWNVL